MGTPHQIVARFRLHEIVARFHPPPAPPLRPAVPSPTPAEKLIVGNGAHVTYDPRSPSGYVRTSITFHGDGTYTENVQSSVIGLPDFSHSGLWRIRDGRIELRVEATTDARVLPLLTTLSHEILPLNSEQHFIKHEKSGEVMGFLRQSRGRPCPMRVLIPGARGRR